MYGLYRSLLKVPSKISMRRKMMTVRKHFEKFDTKNMKVHYMRNFADLFVCDGFFQFDASWQLLVYLCHCFWCCVIFCVDGLFCCCALSFCHILLVVWLFGVLCCFLLFLLLKEWCYCFLFSRLNTALFYMFVYT